MKIAIMGSGGMGGYIGGRLAQAGRDVVFIARGEHLKAINKRGLRIESTSGDFEIKPAHATDRPDEIGEVDLILFCVKAYDAIEAATLIKPMIGPNTAILPVLNGVDHINWLKDICGPEHVLGGVAVILANIREPGVIKHSAFNSLDFGELAGDISNRCEAIQQILAVDEIEVEALPDILKHMWWKFCGMCGVGGVFAVMRGDKERIFGFEETRSLIRRAIMEVVSVAQAKGFPLSNSVPDDILSGISSAPPQYKPSILVDLERGNRLEIEALNGTLSRYGKEVGVPTPINDFIYACLKPYENGLM